MGAYNFRQDLAAAKKTELEVAQVYMQKGAKAWHVPQDYKTCDLCIYWSDDYFDKIEVKEDFMVAMTGNVAVEYSCRGAPSGVSVSKADWYVYKLHAADGSTSLHEIPTAYLRVLCEESKFKHVIGGDRNSNTKLVLIPVQIFKDACFRIGEAK